MHRHAPARLQVRVSSRTSVVSVVVRLRGGAGVDGDVLAGPAGAEHRQPAARSRNQRIRRGAGSGGAGPLEESDPGSDVPDPEEPDPEEPDGSEEPDPEEPDEPDEEPDEPEPEEPDEPEPEEPDPEDPDEPDPEESSPPEPAWPEPERSSPEPELERSSPGAEEPDREWLWAGSSSPWRPRRSSLRILRRTAAEVTTASRTATTRTRAGVGSGAVAAARCFACRGADAAASATGRLGGRSSRRWTIAGPEMAAAGEHRHGARLGQRHRRTAARHELGDPLDERAAARGPGGRGGHQRHRRQRRRRRPHAHARPVHELPQRVARHPEVARDRPPVSRRSPPSGSAPRAGARAARPARPASGA